MMSMQHFACSLGRTNNLAGSATSSEKQKNQRTKDEMGQRPPTHTSTMTTKKMKPTPTTNSSWRWMVGCSHSSRPGHLLISICRRWTLQCRNPPRRQTILPHRPTSLRARCRDPRSGRRHPIPLRTHHRPRRPEEIHRPGSRPPSCHLFTRFHDRYDEFPGADTEYCGCWTFASREDCIYGYVGYADP